MLPRVRTTTPPSPRGCGSMCVRSSAGAMPGSRTVQPLSTTPKDPTAHGWPDRKLARTYTELTQLRESHQLALSTLAAEKGPHRPSPERLIRREVYLLPAYGMGAPLPG
jgi:hypothetical protein